MNTSLTIGKLAKKTQISIDSIRFYERRGLLAEPLRTETNYRLYPLSAVERLRFIKKTQNLGFSLDEIKDLLALRQDELASKAEVKERTDEKIRTIQAKIQDLKRMLEVLQGLSASCDGQGSVEDCPILAALAQDDGQKCHQ